MIGAIVGDIVGSRFELTNATTFDFDLFSPKCHFTDDTVMTLAIASALQRSLGSVADTSLQSNTALYTTLATEAIQAMRHLGQLYPDCGFGASFRKWLRSPQPQPYNSCGNGAAMRVSACAYAAATFEDVKDLSTAVTAVSHNHPEGLKGAEATAVAIFLARQGYSKEQLRSYLSAHYYPLNFTLEQLRPHYHYDATCQGSVPQALQAFFEGEDFVDTLRKAVYLGGDSDTIAAIAGSIAEAFYGGVPEEICTTACGFLDQRLMRILLDFEEAFPCSRLAAPAPATPTHSAHGTA